MYISLYHFIYRSIEIDISIYIYIQISIFTNVNLPNLIHLSIYIFFVYPSIDLSIFLSITQLRRRRVTRSGRVCVHCGSSDRAASSCSEHGALCNGLRLPATKAQRLSFRRWGFRLDLLRSSGSCTFCSCLDSLLPQIPCRAPFSRRFFRRRRRGRGASRRAGTSVDRLIIHFARWLT